MKLICFALCSWATLSQGYIWDLQTWRHRTDQQSFSVNVSVSGWNLLPVDVSGYQWMSVVSATSKTTLREGFGNSVFDKYG